jgi:tRNA-dihydrouridine synthase B
MRIGPYQLASSTVVAPMAGVSDRPFRELCRSFAAGLAVGEMVSANAALWSTRKSRQRLDHAGEVGPVSVQILGTSPAQLADAARASVDLGAQIVDVNMGCPAKKVCRVAAGSALLRDEGLVGRILDAVVRAAGVPVTLKMRTGWDPAHRNGAEIARIAEHAGVTAITVHGRTRACGFTGTAEYDTIRTVKQVVSIPVIANGDIDSGEKAAAVLAYTGADGIMVGRAAWGRPWLFAEIAEYLATGRRRPAPTAAQVADIVLGHIERLHDFYGAVQGVRIARKHIAWYARCMAGYDSFRERVNRAVTAREQRQLVAAFFEAAPTTLEEKLVA